jgi:hypothetical protein
MRYAAGRDNTRVGKQFLISAIKHAITYKGLFKLIKVETS